MYLAGAKELKLDAKARLTLPADFRKEFGDKVALVPMTDALYGFTPDGFAGWMEGIFTDDFKEQHSNWRDIEVYITGSCTMLDIDNAGRIALGKVDEESRKELGIDRDAVVIGRGQRFEIRSAAAWKALKQSITKADLSAVQDSLHA